MMDVNSLSQLITGIGFPAACCVVLFMQNSKFQKTLTDISVTMAQITDRLSDIENKIGDK